MTQEYLEAKVEYLETHISDLRSRVENLEADSHPSASIPLGEMQAQIKALEAHVFPDIEA